MSHIKELVLRFKQATAPDVVKNRVYVHGPNLPFDPTAPFDEFAKPAADADGFTRVPLANLPKLVGLEGQYDLDVTAIDAAGNESDPLEIDNQTFDLSPPDAPTDGAVE